MEKFAGYGFPKAHSAAYAYLAFVTAYLKTHYPIEFMSALLTSESGNTAKVVKYINECREMGIAVLPPDVNSSEFTLYARTAKRFALAWARSRTSARTPWNRSSKPAPPAAPSFAVRFLRARRSRRGQPPHDRELHQGRRAWIR